MSGAEDLLYTLDMLKFDFNTQGKNQQAVSKRFRLHKRLKCFSFEIYVCWVQIQMVINTNKFPKCTWRLHGGEVRYIEV